MNHKHDKPERVMIGPVHVALKFKKNFFSR